MEPIDPTDRSASVRANAAPDIELRLLRALVALVDSGTMTAAARRLGISQSTVSEAIAALDRALGTPAVARRSGAKGHALTDAGRALLPHARRILAVLTEAQADVAAVAREGRARVEVIANESLSTYLLPRALADLRSRWPNTLFAVTVGTCDAVREGLREDRFDVGLSFATDTIGAAKKEAGEATVLADLPLVLFASPAHPAAVREDTSSREALAAYTVFSSDASGAFHDLLRHFFLVGSGGPRLEAAGSVEAVKRTVTRDPRALGVLPSYAVADELRAGVFRRVELRPRPPHVRLEAQVSTSRPQSPAAAELVVALRELAMSRAVRAAGRRVTQASPATR